MVKVIQAKHTALYMKEEERHIFSTSYFKYYKTFENNPSAVSCKDRN